MNKAGLPRQRQQQAVRIRRARHPPGITPEALKQAIRTRFSDLQVWPDILHFQPEKLGWPTAYFPGHDLKGDDLNVHEIDEIILTEAAATVFSQAAANLFRRS